MWKTTWGIVLASAPWKGVVVVVAVLVQFYATEVIEPGSPMKGCLQLQDSFHCCLLPEEQQEKK